MRTCSRKRFIVYRKYVMFIKHYHIPVLCLSHQYSSYSTGSSVGVWYDECDTTSVIRWVWYDECDTMSVIRCKFYGGKNVEKNVCWIFFCWNFFFWFFFSIFNFFVLYNFIYFVATTRHTEHCTLLVVFEQTVICKVKNYISKHIAILILYGLK